jgi:histone deacetylase complex subunit SAP18
MHGKRVFSIHWVYRKDVTLRELASLIGKNNDKATQRNVRISFKTVYQDSLRGGRVSVKPLGMILNHRKTPEDRKTLEELKFVAGDMLDVSVQEDTGRPSSNDRSRLHSSGSSNNYQRYSGREHGRMDRRTDSWSNKREDRFESRRVDRYRG